MYNCLSILFKDIFVVGLKDCGCLNNTDYINILNQVALYKYPVLINNSNNNNIAYSDNPILKDKNNIFLSLADEGHYFWINQNGNIIHNHQNKSNKILFQNIETFLSKLSGKKIKIFKTSMELEIWHLKYYREYEKIQEPIKKIILKPRENEVCLALDTLPIVLGDVFDVHKEKFATYDNRKTFYINKFYRCDNLLHNIFILKTPDIYSITMQYLYHISGYNKDKFNYIICWLANMFRYITNNSNIDFDPKLLKSILVLVGGEKTGKEMFFNNIVKPLFGEDYCLKIDNELLLHKNLEKEKSNKIFYNFDNISSSSLKDMKKKELIRDILIKQDKNIVGIVITTDTKYIPYDLSGGEYKVFELPDNIAKIYMPEMYRYNDLKDCLDKDLPNFSSILKRYAPSKEILYIKDIDTTKKPTLEDCIIEFASELTDSQNMLNQIDKVKWNNADETFENIKKLYDKHKKVERKYIYELFKQKYDHDISATALYKRLKELDENFFKTVPAPGGAKCFYFPDKN